MLPSKEPQLRLVACFSEVQQQKTRQGENL